MKYKNFTILKHSSNIKHYSFFRYNINNQKIRDINIKRINDFQFFKDKSQIFKLYSMLNINKNIFEGD